MTLNRPVSAAHARDIARHASDYLTCATAWENAGACGESANTYKAEMAHKGRALLRGLANAAGLREVGPITTRFNAGGPAVSGEVYLSAEGLHAWVEVSCVMGSVLTYRTRREVPIDGAGTFRMEDGPNHSQPVHALADATHAAYVALLVARVAAEGRGQ